MNTALCYASASLTISGILSIWAANFLAELVCYVCSLVMSITGATVCTVSVISVSRSFRGVKFPLFFVLSAFSSLLLRIDGISILGTCVSLCLSALMVSTYWIMISRLTGLRLCRGVNLPCESNEPCELMLSIA